MAIRSAHAAPRVAFLSMSYYSYRVPLFDELHRKFGDGFLVVALRSSTSERTLFALHRGTFPRQLIKGTVVNSRLLTKRFDSGRRTPIGPAIAPALSKVLRQFKPDVVISINLSSWTLTSIALGYPTIIFWEGTAHTERTVGRFRLLARRWMARRARAFVTNGKLSQDYVAQQLGVPDGAIFQGGLGPELPPLPPKASRRDAERVGPVNFLFVGQIVFRKGVPHLLHAARCLIDEGYSTRAFQVTFLGDGTERASMEWLARELGLGDVVHFAGAVDSSEVWKFYDACDVFVLPTLHDNWPLVVPEAMSMGKPVLVSKYAGSVPDVVYAGENGFAFDPDDYSELARLMSSYIEQPQAVAVQGARSREIAKEYTPERVAQTYIRAVDYVLSGENTIRK